MPPRLFIGVKLAVSLLNNDSASLLRRSGLWRFRAKRPSCVALRSIRPGEYALTCQFRRPLFLVDRARQRRHERDEIVDLTLGQGERLDVFVEIRILQAVTFVVVIDDIPERFLRTIVKVRSGHEHVAYVRRLERGNVFLLLGNEKAA